MTSALSHIYYWIFRTQKPKIDKFDQELNPAPYISCQRAKGKY